MRRRAHGFTLVEVLIALVVLAFGVLSLARLLARAGATELEAVQRTQAMALAQDIVDRINSNRANAVQYIGDYVPGGQLQDCAGDGVAIVDRDRCQWTNQLAGALVLDENRPIGAPLGARGCVVASAPNVYVIAVAWQGVNPTEAPDNDCGAGAFDREANRRVYSTVVQIATLGV